MKYQITASQRHFFETNQYIEFESLITASEQEILLKALAKSTKKRDLALHQSDAQKILFAPKFGQIASELSLVTPLRYGFDEQVTEKTLFSCLQNERCIHGLEIAMVLSLKGTGTKEQESLFPTAPCNAIFFLTNRESDPLLFVPQKDQVFLLMAWGNRELQYLLNPKDDFTHELKREGYVFGDLLRQTTHPVVWR